MLSNAPSHLGRHILASISKSHACSLRWAKRANPRCVASFRHVAAAAAGSSQFSGTPGQIPALLASRRATQAQAPTEQFPIVGVSFENRQEKVKLLRPGQGLLFIREPNNPYDPNAVAIHTTGGDALGYVPRDLTLPFVHAVVPGYVRAATLNPEGLYGARVLVRPSLPGLLLQQLPASLWAQGCADLQALLGKDYAQLHSETLAASGQRCEVTGLGADRAKLLVSPMWRLDVERRTAVLTRCYTVCDAVYEAERMLDPARGAAGVPSDGRDATTEAQRVADLFQDINFWRMQDIWAYVQHCHAVQQQLPGDVPWQFELARPAR